MICSVSGVLVLVKKKYCEGFTANKLLFFSYVSSSRWELTTQRANLVSYNDQYFVRARNSAKGPCIKISRLKETMFAYLEVVFIDLHITPVTGHLLQGVSNIQCHACPLYAFFTSCLKVLKIT